VGKAIANPIEQYIVYLNPSIGKIPQTKKIETVSSTIKIPPKINKQPAPLETELLKVKHSLLIPELTTPVKIIKMRKLILKAPVLGACEAKSRAITKSDNIVKIAPMKFPRLVRLIFSSGSVIFLISGTAKINISNPNGPTAINHKLELYPFHQASIAVKTMKITAIMKYTLHSFNGMI